MKRVKTPDSPLHRRGGGGEAKKKKPAKKTGNNFFMRVYVVARKIPRGRVTSYGAIAKYLGAGKSSRMVGWAMNNAGSVLPPVPAHRVVNRIGLLTGQHHFAYPGQMQELLENEGIKVLHNKVKDFEELFWNPMQELKPFK
ncbi:MAG: MGMT family protein [Chitinophagales bacterium]|nr:MGMT family protein [Chitinophagales bacterium]